MTDKAVNKGEPPLLTVQRESGRKTIVLTGSWDLRNLAVAPDLRKAIRRYAAVGDVQWDISQVDLLDSAAAFILWQSWGGKIPADVQMRSEHQRLFERWHGRKIPMPKPARVELFAAVHYTLRLIQGFGFHLVAWFTLFGRLILDLGYLLQHPRAVPWKEISFNVYQAGVRALGITALVGFLVGVSMSYLSALQLQKFGAEIYIIDLLGLSVIRELGPMLAAILIAGRSGSSMTAEIGIMRVTQELDALSAMGISHSVRLVLPKVIALAIAMPLLIVWTDTLALIGGIVSAQLTMDIGYQQFLDHLPKAVPIANFYISIAKGSVFGVMIAMIACHFGFIIKPNTESLGNETTNSVVVAITVVILVNTVFSIAFRNVGFP
ncbi:MAG: ABC transporter permease [Methylobacter sp.]|nr:ABC transporter permease [Methylobacter sp.]